MNAEIAKVDSKRVGTFEVAHNLVHIKPGGEYAMFQHGDQATYWEIKIMKELLEMKTKQSLYLL